MPNRANHGSWDRPAKLWSGTENSGPEPNRAACTAAGDAGGDHEGHQGPTRELEQQQLDGEYDGRERCAERGRHPRRSPARQQHLAFVGRHVQHLAEE